MNYEDVHVGLSLKPDMSDAEVYQVHHGRALLNLPFSHNKSEISPTI